MQLSRESPKQYLNKFFTLEMKILRFIFAIPLGILLSFLSFYVVNMLINVAKFINTSNYPISDYLSTLASGAVLVSAITYIAPSKRKIFLFIASFIGLIIFISNIIFIKDIQEVLFDLKTYNPVLHTLLFIANIILCCLIYRFLQRVPFVRILFYPLKVIVLNNAEIKLLKSRYINRFIPKDIFLDIVAR